MSSENSQGYLWIPCEFFSSMANQIMCNQQSALEYSFTLQETSSNVVFRAKTRLCRVNIYLEFDRTFVLLSAHIKTAVYQGMVMQTRAVCNCGHIDIEFCL